MSKKLIALILLFILAFTACSAPQDDVTEPSAEEVPYQPLEPERAEETRGVWISYIEITDNCSSEEKLSSFMEGMLTDFERIGITDIFFHVRPFGDALYPSELFPTSSTITERQGDELSFDPLRVALDISSEYGMRLHAWINPYRASRDSDLDKLSDDNRAKIWYLEGTGDVNLIGGRYYFNPASERVRELITEGCSELMRRYPDLAGIHIDDYFYPENCGSFDNAEYKSYRESGGDMRLPQWRRENVNILVRELYKKVKSFGEDKLFTISPNGKIDTCMNELYADVELWAAEEGYCDMLLPQIYFGFENMSQPFERCLDGWTAICTSPKVRLVPALALYKCGEEDTHAGLTGRTEWIDNSDIIKRQVQCIEEKGLSGFALYSGTYVNFSESFYKKELDNLISVL